MQIINLKESDWWDCLLALEEYSFFVTPQWGQILSKSRLGIDCRALLFKFPEGEILFPCGFSRNRLGLLYCQSMPYGCYGGPRIIRLDAGYSPTKWSFQIRRYFYHYFLFGRLIASPGPYAHLPLGQASTIVTTHHIDLTLGVEPVWKSFEKTVRSNIRKAERMEVVVRVDLSMEGFKTYYQMLEASALRWGNHTQTMPWSLFEAICQSGFKHGNIKLWIAYWHEQAVAGMLWFYGKSEAFYWSGAMFKNFASTRANELLMWSAIKDAASMGYKVVNLGASGELEGVRKFKEGFGPQEVKYPIYEYQSTLMQYSQRIAKIRGIQ